MSGFEPPAVTNSPGEPCSGRDGRAQKSHQRLSQGYKILLWTMICLAALYAFLRLAGYLLFVRKPRAR
jgi:hypothetical protein